METMENTKFDTVLFEVSVVAYPYRVTKHYFTKKQKALDFCKAVSAMSADISANFEKKVFLNLSNYSDYYWYNCRKIDLTADEYLRGEL